MTSVDHYPTRIDDLPRCIDRIEPVAWQGWSPDAPLSREAYDAYDRDGFLCLPDVFSPEEVEKLREDSSRLRGREGDLDPRTVFTEKTSGDVRTVFQLHTQSPLMGALAADRRLAGVAEFLLDDQVYIHQSRLNYKPGFRGQGFYWHSDFETWHAEDGMPRMRALSMSVLLTDNDPTNGALMLIPGSQRTFVATVGQTPEDNFRSSLKEQTIGVPDDENLKRMVEEGGIAMPTAKAGSVVIFDCNTMHGSGSNITPMPRSNAFFVYNSVSNRLVAPFSAPKPRPEMIGARENVRAIRVRRQARLWEAA